MTAHQIQTPLRTIESILPKLSPGERAQVLQWLARDFAGSSPGIEKDPGICGGEACVVRTRVPVWTLVLGQRMGLGEAELLASYPTLRAEDLINAWAYARINREEIDNAIAENEAA
jgi:uncharacterized protein (DUF433 family)